ncbi:hypothetical protein HY489_02295 [Candidatus Woesearchaeota archaeon]|nr:hypothetical protein [Candidatus Woesearchaeota archaeon]
MNPPNYFAMKARVLRADPLDNRWLIEYECHEFIVRTGQEFGRINVHAPDGTSNLGYVHHASADGGSLWLRDDAHRDTTHGECVAEYNRGRRGRDQQGYTIIPVQRGLILFGRNEIEKHPLDFLVEAIVQQQGKRA